MGFRAWQMRSPVSGRRPVPLSPRGPIGLSGPVAWPSGCPSLTPRSNEQQQRRRRQGVNMGNQGQPVLLGESCTLHANTSPFFFPSFCTCRPAQRLSGRLQRHLAIPRPLDDALPPRPSLFLQRDNDPARRLSPDLRSQAGQSRSFPSHRRSPRLARAPPPAVCPRYARPELEQHAPCLLRPRIPANSTHTLTC
jgi:hypothetical protein